MSAPRKKLIEVALPLKAINEASAREKSIRHGHPSTLHLWWARRPLAACRAVLFASLVDDPDSDLAYQKANGDVDEEAAGIKRAELFNLIEELVQWENSNNPDVIRSARAEIARCVASRKVELGELNADAELAPGLTVKKFIRNCRCQPIYTGTQKSKKKSDSRRFSFGVTHLPPEDVVNAFLVAHAPPVLDPFCGGGSIPLEAQRLGLRAFASDLNPVPVLITKALIEIPYKFANMPPVNPEATGKLSETEGQGKSKGKKKQKKLAQREWHGAQGLAEDVRYYGKWIRDEAEKRIGHLYPKINITEEMAGNRPDLKEYVAEELTVIAWLWARTVPCSNPACGKQMPLVRSFSLSTKSTPPVFVEPMVEATGDIRFIVQLGKGQVPPGTVKNRSVTCCYCGEKSTLQYVRDQAQAGHLGARMLAIALEGNRSRVFVEATERDEKIARHQSPAWIPDERVPTPCHDVDRLPMYGMAAWGNAFSQRQAVALTVFSELVMKAREQVITDQSANAQHEDVVAYADAVATYLAFAHDKCCDYWSTIATWAATGGFVRGTFARQALQMTWDYCECNPFSNSTANWLAAIEWVALAVANLSPTLAGQVMQRDATAPTPVEPPLFVSTDPPYYDNISYSDLSDYFYVWLRRTIGKLYSQLFATVITPRTQELIASPYRHEGSKEAAKQFFETGLANAFRRIREVHPADVPLTVYYAFKQSEEDDDDDGSDVDHEEVTTVSTGWETMLSALIHSQFSIFGTWPVRTERGARSLGLGTNALASSIVLVCRPRPDNSPLATRKEFISTLRQELPGALRNLQHGNIAPVDLAQAAIGPGMSVFTRYAKVIESDGTPMTVRTALATINTVLDEVLAEQEGDFDADTRWALAWFDQYGMSEGPFGVAETLSKAKNTAINGLVDAGVVRAKSGKVQLVSRVNMSDEWNPATDSRLTVWETAQHLIRTLESHGEGEAALLLNQLGGIGETARELAYRLYSICERNKWAEEALAYNSLVTAWPELSKLALASRNRGPAATQSDLFS